MKKITWLLVIMLLLGCLAACQSQKNDQSYHSVENLSQNKKDQISRDFYELSGNTIDLWYDNGDLGGARYYGSENGYDILLIYTHFGIPGSKTIAEYKFESYQQFYLYAYKGGKFHQLSDIYADGMISKKAIEIAHQIHRRIEEEIQQQWIPDQNDS